MNLKSTIKYFLLSFLFTFLFIPGPANPPGELGTNQWVLSLQAGLAAIGTEMTPGLEALQNEFNHHPGVSFDLALSHTLFKHWEVGANFERNYLSGDSKLPDFSAAGVHPRFMVLYQQPVYYQTVSTSYYFFTRYYLRPFPKVNWNVVRFDPFLEFGLGANRFKTALNYRTVPQGAPSADIFVKGQTWNPMPGSSARYNIGTGTRINFKSSLNFIFSLDLDLINSDCMDAVHNYDASGTRLNAFTLLPRFRLGVVIPISNSLHGGTPYLPWAP